MLIFFVEFDITDEFENIIDLLSTLTEYKLIDESVDIYEFLSPRNSS